MAERLDARQWGDWWRKQRLTSFHGHFENNYDGPLRQYWETRFAKLPPGAHILDLATGNGALALLAAEYSARHERGFHITGIDYAAIQPDSLKKQYPLLGEVRFLSHTAMEATGLETASQDLVMSQFGVEYGDLPATLKEIHRLLKPGACFSALVHHQDSAVLAQAREALAQIKRCEKSGVAETATALVDLQQTLAREGRLSASDQQRARRLHQTLGSNLEKLNRYTRQLKDPSHVRMFTQSIMILFDRRNAARISPGQRLDAIQKLMEENHNYRQRMKDLRSAAFNDQDLNQLKSRLVRLGFQPPEIHPLDYAGEHFCHSIDSCL